MEHGGVKVPETRLRRQLSVEQSDDQRSSPGPSTLTKKSTLAKPQLESIEEHAVTDPSLLPTTRELISGDISATAEKPVTPARHSTRVKSNTSLVSEAGEKLITPSRRSTRIKSNTSTVSEASQSAESPRAKRVIRKRNSHIGSDTETPVTPARTRRTNQASVTGADKDSSRTSIVNDIVITPGRTRKRTFTIDMPAEAIYTEQPAPLITEVIAEVHSNIGNDSIENRDDSPTTRQSPRLMAKKGMSVSKKSDIIIENVSQENRIAEDTYQGTKTSSEATPHNEISINSANLINDLDKKAKSTSQKNKSMSEIEGTKTKHHRTKSWTTLCASPSNPTGSNFYSDNESAKKKIEQFGSLFKFSDTGSGDGPKQIIVEQRVDKESDSTVNPTKKSRKNKDKSFSAGIPENESLADTQDEDKSVSNKENILDVLPLKKTLSTVDLLFEQHPSDEKTVVFLEDSDSNTGSLGKQSNDKQLVGDDQCVPAVLQPSETQASAIEKPVNVFAINSEHVSTNDIDCEPMDIDKTWSENVSLSLFTAESKQSRKSSITNDIDCEPMDIDKTWSENVTLSLFTAESKQSRKSSISLKQKNVFDDSSNQSKRKSSVHSISQIVEEPNTDEMSIHEKLKEKKACKSSISMSPHVGIITKETSNKSNTKSSLSSSSLQVTIIKNSVNESIDANSKGKQSHELGMISIDTPNKAKRKSSLSNSTSLDHDKSLIDYNSTFLLSQIKDMSAPKNSVSKSPQVFNELSKSVDIQSIGKDELVSKNITLKYLTSTPIEQKHFEKLGIAMNSSITPTWGNNKETNKILKEDLLKKKSVNDSSSEDSDKCNGVESSQDKSNLLDDFAEDARDGYESGDSQDKDDTDETKDTALDAEEIGYKKKKSKRLFESLCNENTGNENEITIFNEKVKDKEDPLTINVKQELKMPQKDFEMSTVKINDELEQMLIDEDVNMMKANDSVDVSQDKDDTDETKDTALDAEEIGYKKKKSKRLFESLCNENTGNENEITIFNEKVKDKEDPLTINVKQELKMPQKDFEISTVKINDELEQMLIDEDVNMMKANDSVDPLQAAMVQDENYSGDDHSVSEIEEITNNYDYVSEELNKESKKLLQSRDSSLNLNKKLKQKKAAIVAELNLAQTKVSKKDETKQAKKKTITRVFKKLADNDDTSDSNNLKMCYSGESDGSKEKDSFEKDEVTEEEYFIPVKHVKITRKRKMLSASQSSADTSSEGSCPWSTSPDSNSLVLSNKRNKMRSDSTEDLWPQPSCSHVVQINSNTRIKRRNVVKEQTTREPETIAHIEMNEVSTGPCPRSTSPDSNNPVLSNKRNKMRSDITEDLWPQPSCSHVVQINSNTRIKRRNVVKVQTTREPEIIAHIEMNEVSTGPCPRSTSPDSNNPVLSNKRNKMRSDITEDLWPQPSCSHVVQINSNTRIKRRNVVKVQTTREPEIIAHIEMNEVSTGPCPRSTSPDSNNPVLSNKRNKMRSDITEDLWPQPSCSHVVQINSNTRIKRRNVVKVQTTREPEIIAHIEMNEVSTGSCPWSTSPDSNSLVLSNKRNKMRSDSTEDLWPQPSCSHVVQINSNTRIKRRNVVKEQTTREPETIAHIEMNEVSTGFEMKAKRKRKHQDDNERAKQYKILKEDSFDEIHAPRLSSRIIDREIIQKKKSKIGSTTGIDVEKITKPSKFLEETVCLNNDLIVKKQMKHTLNRPRVMPTIPTASTSASGSTTTFQVEVIPQIMEFVGQRNQVPKNNRNKNLDKNRLKKLRSHVHNKHRNMKLSKH